MLAKIALLAWRLPKLQVLHIHSAQLTLYDQKLNVSCTHSTASCWVSCWEPSPLVYRT